jgi:hypothetical protein
MAKKTTAKPSDKQKENLTVETTGGTEEKAPMTATDTSYIDSDSNDPAKSMMDILGVPTENVDAKPPEQSATKSDVLDMGTPEPGLDDDTGFTDQEDVDSGLFEDNELLAEIGIELIDMVMTYGAMAVAKDFENEDKYTIKDSRKKKLRKPLEKILESREVKTAPELVFVFMMIVSYSPIMIEAVQERRRKKKEAEAEEEGNPVPRMRAVRSEPTPPPSVVPESPEEIVEPDDDPLRDFVEKGKHKNKPGRPAGSSDMKPRKSFDKPTREKMIAKAKDLKKKGWSVERIADDIGVSNSTIKNWLKKG